MKSVLATDDIRIEAEYYISETVSFDCIKGIDIEAFSQYGTSKELNEEHLGYPVLRLNEFDSFFISEPAKYCDLIDTETYESLKLMQNDVLICRTNGNPKYVGNAALVPKDYEYAFASYLYRIRPRRDIINPATLVTFLNSKYGRKEIERYAMVGNQTNFSPAKFRQISIPKFSKAINDEIENLVYSAFNLSESGKLLYAEAENVLICELGLKDFDPECKPISIKQIKESFLASGRLDAEYYSKKYRSYLDLIKSYKNGYSTLPQMCDIVEQNYSPIHAKVYKYIELSNIGSLGDIKGFSQLIGAELPSRARRVVHTGDVIISSIEGSLQCIALVDVNNDSALCSTGFYVLEPRSINPETLLVLFKSEPMQNLLKQQCSGTILTSINHDDLKNIIVPNIRKTVQEQIADYIQKSISLRQQARQLLEDAKLKIEVAVTGGVTIR